jgi:xanthine dehydrogenase small subunit
MTAEYPDANLLAGGTDLGLKVTKALQDPVVFIYTGNVAELREIQRSESHLEIGSAASLSDAMKVIVEHLPNLEELFLRFASPPIRNAGTLGGNVANGSPIGDSMPALLALDSELEICRRDSTRTVPLDEFYLSYQSTALEPGEFITRIRIPLPSASSIIRSYKISKRFDQDISAVCAAFRLDIVDDQVVDARVAFGGMAEIPKRALHCEREMAGNAFTETTVIAAQAALDKDFVPVSDLRASADYRRKVCRNLLKRLYLDVTGQEKAGVYRYDR